MLRFLIICIGTYSIYAAMHSDLKNTSMLFSRLFPLINTLYLIFLFKEFVTFLVKLSAHGSKKKEVDFVDFLYDLWTLLYAEIENKYLDKFAIFGRHADWIRDLVVPIEIVLVVVSFFNELEMIAEMAS